MTGIALLKINVKIEPRTASGQNGSPPAPRLPECTRTLGAAAGTAMPISRGGTRSPISGMPMIASLVTNTVANTARSVSYSSASAAPTILRGDCYSPADGEHAR